MKDICQSSLYIKKCNISRYGLIKKRCCIYVLQPQYAALSAGKGCRLQEDLESVLAMSLTFKAVHSYGITCMDVSNRFHGESNKIYAFSRESSHVRNSGQFLMRSMLRVKEDPSSLNINFIWFQGFIWPNSLVPHRSNRTDGVTSPETVALKAFKALDLCPLTSDIWPLTADSSFLVLSSWFLVPDIWFLTSVLRSLIPISYLPTFCPLPSDFWPLTAGPCTLRSNVI